MVNYPNFKKKIMYDVHMIFPSWVNVRFLNLITKIFQTQTKCFRGYFSWSVAV